MHCAFGGEGGACAQLITNLIKQIRKNGNRLNWELQYAIFEENIIRFHISTPTKKHDIQLTCMCQNEETAQAPNQNFYNVAIVSTHFLCYRCTTV